MRAGTEHRDLVVSRTFLYIYVKMYLLRAQAKQSYFIVYECEELSGV